LRQALSKNMLLLGTSTSHEQTLAIDKHMIGTKTSQWQTFVRLHKHFPGAKTYQKHVRNKKSPAKKTF